MLDLKFLQGQERNTDHLNDYEKILHEFGEEIQNYAKGYFTYLVSSSSFNETVQSASLYIVIDEIKYDYKVIMIDKKDLDNVNVSFFTLKTKETETTTHPISDNFREVKAKIKMLLESPLCDLTFSFLVYQVKMKRDNKLEL